MTKKRNKTNVEIEYALWEITKKIKRSINQKDVLFAV